MPADEEERAGTDTAPAAEEEEADQVDQEEVPTQTPMWGHPMPVLGALSPFLEPFRGRLRQMLTTSLKK